MIKAVIFDLDGVLVHTDELHYRAWKKMADEEGIYFDYEINNRLRGVSRMASLEIILERATKKYTKAEKEALANHKNDYYVASLSTLNHASLENGVREVLLILQERGLRLAIGSSSKNARPILEKIELINFFEVISDGIGLKKPKPDPEVFLKAAKGLNLKPEECIVVEDAKAGIDAAIKGGFVAVGMGDAALYENNTYSIKELKEILLLVKVA